MIVHPSEESPSRALHHFFEAGVRTKLGPIETFLCSALHLQKNVTLLLGQRGNCGKRIQQDVFLLTAMLRGLHLFFSLEGKKTTFKFRLLKWKCSLSRLV